MRKRTAWTLEPRPEGEPSRAGPGGAGAQYLRSGAGAAEAVLGLGFSICVPAAWTMVGRGGKNLTRGWEVMGPEVQRRSSQPCGPMVPGSAGFS